MPKIERALISVSDKSSVLEFAKFLANKGVEILSTGGTAKLLRDNHVKVIEVSDFTGFPEMLDGRVKTLHPKIHGGLLGMRQNPEHIAKMKEYGIPNIDMLVVNLYPFGETIKKENCPLEEAIENIDIGGPTMLRAGAKNYPNVTVLVNPSDYEMVIEEMNKTGEVSSETNFNLAVKVYQHTAKYDGMIANYLGQKVADNIFPDVISFQYDKLQALRYGENAHQQGAFYIDKEQKEASIASAKQLHGKELSYNNIADADAALECVKQFSQPSCVIVKHANPCGVATDKTLLEAYNKAYLTDTESAFGGVIAFNQALDEATAVEICERQFVEVIIAPKVSQEALAAISKKKNVRVLETGYWQSTNNELDFKKVCGGILIQTKDNQLFEALKVVTKRKPTEAELKDLEFAFKIAKFVKSNAIVYCKNMMTIGVGAGQMSRVNSARIAGIKAENAGLETKGSVMASDAFFPFRDGIDNAASAGITAIIQPRGSVRDQEVIDAADEHNIAMVFTNMRHFRH